MSPYRIADTRHDARECDGLGWLHAILVSAAAVVAVVLLSSGAVGCSRPIDTAVAAANAAHDVGDAAAAAIEAGCTERYALAHAADVPEIDRVCLPAAKAYSAYRAAHAALVAGIQAAEGGRMTPVEVLALAGRLRQAERALADAMGAIR